MMRISTTMLLLVALAAATPTLAQNAPPKNNDAIKNMHTVNDGGPQRGANSFTQSQARRHIVNSGFSHVSMLTKDSGGIWRGTARKGGATVHVALDFKGNVSTGE